MKNLTAQEERKKRDEKKVSSRDRGGTTFNYHRYIEVKGGTGVASTKKGGGGKGKKRGRS